MTGALHDVARAALPVAIALLGLAAAARAVRWLRIDDAQAQRIASQHLDPLSTWCLVAAAVCTLARGAAGDSLLALAFPVLIGVAAVLLRTPGETSEPVADEPEAPAPTAPAPPRAGSLWARENH